MRFLIVLSAALLGLASAQQCDPTPQLPDGQFETLTQFENCDQLAQAPQAVTYCTTYHDGISGCPCQCDRVVDQGQPLSKPAPSPSPGDANGPADGAEDGAGEAAACFPESTTVLTENGRVTMADLVKMKNVKVQTLNDKNEFEFSPVEWWIHADPNTETNFYSLATESGHKLHLSDRHLVYVTPCEQPGKRTPKFARNVKLGECAFVQDPENNLIASPIVSIDQQQMTGIYSPITETGSIIVDGIAASVFSTIENESVQKMLFSYLKVAKNFIPNWFTGLEVNSEVINIPEIMMQYLELSKHVFV